MLRLSRNTLFTSNSNKVYNNSKETPQNNKPIMAWRVRKFLLQKLEITFTSHFSASKYSNSRQIMAFSQPKDLRRHTGVCRFAAYI